MFVMSVYQQGKKKTLRFEPHDELGNSQMYLILFHIYKVF